MFNQKKWFVLFAVLFLGLAFEWFAPESFIRTANAETKTIAENAAEEEGAPLKLLCAEDIWKSVFRDVMYGEMTNKKLAAMALAEVKKRDLELMSSATDHIVNYHGRRFAITEEDYQVLLKIVQSEAGGEDLKGKLLVANVVLNRVEVGFCGNTITEVVFAPGQFSPVASGRIFRVVPDETTIEAVELALKGEDQSQGALYFICRPLASKSGIRWFDKNLKFLFKHGCHEFYIEKD